MTDVRSFPIKKDVKNFLRFFFAPPLKFLPNECILSLTFQKTVRSTIRMPIMPISFSEENKTFHLDTEHTSYVMQIGPSGELRHLYYGASIASGDDLVCPAARPRLLPLSGVSDCKRVAQYRQSRDLLLRKRRFPQHRHPPSETERQLRHFHRLLLSYHPEGQGAASRTSRIVRSGKAVRNSGSGHDGFLFRCPDRPAVQRL